MKKAQSIKYLALFLSFFLVDGYRHAASEGTLEEEYPLSIVRKKVEEIKPLFLSKLKLSGYLKNETAYRYHEPFSFTKMRNIGYLDARYPISSRLNFTFAGWAYYDMVYDFYDYDTISSRSVRDADNPLVFIEGLKEEKDSPVAELRELYLDLFLDNADIRIGKQYVIWGVLEGQRVTDEINPMDFRELILPDLLDFRIPLWTLKINYFLKDYAVEFLWIPDIRFHKPAPEGSEWELLQEVPGTEYPKSFTLKNSEMGIKVTKNIFDTELTLSYLYTWDDYPVIFRTVKIDQTVDPVFNPVYTRMPMYGATFTRPLWRTILKGEAVYATGKYFGIGLVDEDQDGYVDNEGELKRDHIRWGIGLDFNMLGAEFSPSFLQWIILNHDDSILMDQYDNSFALFVRKELPQQSMEWQLLMLHFINMDETLLSPKITLRITDEFQVSMGMNLFYGKKAYFGSIVGEENDPDLQEVETRFQFLGNFDRHDRVFMEFKYGF